MKTTTNTPEQNKLAREYLDAANAKAKRGELWIDTVQIKVVTKANAPRVFAPGVAEIVRRYLGCQSVML